MKLSLVSATTTLVANAAPQALRLKSRLRAGYDPDTDMSRGGSQDMSRGGSQDMSSGSHDLSRGH